MNTNDFKDARERYWRQVDRTTAPRRRLRLPKDSIAAQTLGLERCVQQLQEEISAMALEVAASHAEREDAEAELHRIEKRLDAFDPETLAVELHQWLRDQQLIPASLDAPWSILPTPHVRALLAFLEGALPQ